MTTQFGHWDPPEEPILSQSFLNRPVTTDLHKALLEIAHEFDCRPDMRSWRDTGSEFAMVYGKVHSVTEVRHPDD